MKALFCFFIALLVSSSLFSAPAIVQRDNGRPVASGYLSRPNWDETVLLQPDGPCNITEIQIYFTGTQAGKDTIYIVGDPAEGAICPTRWVWEYNTKHAPIVVDYSGTPGWVNIPVTGLRSDGYDRIVIQHILKANGPWFAYDDNSCGTPYTSFLTDETAVYTGGNEAFYIANGDFLVRLKVEYDYPSGNTSAPPPPPFLLEINRIAGLVNAEGGNIGASDVGVVDWNNDGFDDVNIGSYYFQNNGNGTFSNVSSKINVPAGFTSWGDFDNDGNIDVFSAINGAWDDDLKMMFTNNKIYKNNGDGTFTALDNKKVFNLPYPNPADDFLTGKSMTNDSVINPYSCISAVWSDFNMDGKLDLFLANNRVGLNDKAGNYVERYFPDELWLSNPDGTLTNKSKTNGVLSAEPFNAGSSLGYGFFDCYGATACDYNTDLKPDIFVANYRLVRDELLSNDGNGMFTDVATPTGVKGVPTPSRNNTNYGHGMGCEWADFNNDGFPDLAVGNLGHPDFRGYFSNPSLIFRNSGPPNYTFVEQHLNMGLKFYEMNAGVLWADLDLDGWQDLWSGQIAYEAEGTNGQPKRFGRFYLNQGAPDFKLKDATWELGQGVRVHGPWAAARFDFDHDGDIDVLVASGNEGVKLFRNDMKHKGNWLAIRLKGNPAENVNMDAFGSRAIVYAGGKMFYRDLMGSASGTKGTQNSFELLYGLGDAKTIDSVVVWYPNNKRKIHKNINVNTRYFIPYMADAQQTGIATPALDEPQNFKINVPVSTQLTWYLCGGATEYTVQYATNSDFSNAITTKAGTNSTVISGLQANTNFFWRVKAVNGAKESIWSSTWVFSTGMPSPDGPILIAPKNDSTGAPALPLFSWKDATYPIPYGNSTIYELQLSDDATFQNIVQSANNLTTTSYQATEKLKILTKYYWRVRGLNGASIGKWSDTWAFTTVGLPSKGTLLEPHNDTTNVKAKPTFKWNEFAGAVTYNAEIATDSQFANIFYQNKGITSPSFKLFKTMNAGTDYYWHVRGVNDGGEGEWSDTWHFTSEGTKSVEEISPDANELTLKIQPNPITDKAEINFSIPKGGNLSIDLITIKGEKLSTIFEGYLNQGSFKTSWSSEGIDNGLYLIRLSNGNQTISEKILLVR